MRACARAAGAPPAPERELVPLHADADGALAVGRADGRGAYVCPNQACVESMTAAGGLLTRSLRARVSVPDGLWQAVRDAAGSAPDTDTVPSRCRESV